MAESPPLIPRVSVVAGVTLFGDDGWIFGRLQVFKCSAREALAVSLEQKLLAREEAYFVLTSFAHVLLAVLFGELLNPSHFPALSIVAFAVTSKAFALLVGENERFFSRLRWLSVPIAVLSVAILVTLPLTQVALGSAVMILYFLYPRFLNARERSPLDVLFHATRYSIIFWLGYAGPATLVSLTALSIVFLFGITGELLVGLRSKSDWRTTASRLGVTSTVRVVNLLTFSLIILASVTFSQVVDFPLRLGLISLPVPFLVGVSAAAYISRPVSLRRSWTAPISVRKRELIVLLLIVSTLVLLPLATRVNLTRTAPGPNYEAKIGMQTIMTGPHSWDGQWIIFNYASAQDFYYVLLHTNGTLELSHYADGVWHRGIVSVQTTYSPFDWHQYYLRVDDGRLSLSIDNNPVLESPVQDSTGVVRITQSFPYPNFWLVYITEFQVTPLAS
jgi:hypothetical protein